MKKRKSFFKLIVFSLLLCSALCLINHNEVKAERTPYYFVKNCNSWVTLRKTPSTKAKALALIPYGTEVYRVKSYNRGKAKNGFYQIKYRGKTGYVLSKYLGTVLPAKVIKCNTYITLRKSPSTKAKALNKIPKGAWVNWETNSKNGFCRVNYNGKLGYVLKRYLKVYPCPY